MNPIKLACLRELGSALDKADLLSGLRRRRRVTRSVSCDGSDVM